MHVSTIIKLWCQSEQYLLTKWQNWENSLNSYCEDHNSGLFKSVTGEITGYIYTLNVNPSDHSGPHDKTISMHLHD